MATNKLLKVGKEALTDTEKQQAVALWKGNKRQRAMMEFWLTPTSETFGNAYRSGLKAGFSKSYSANITHLAPHWLSEYIDRLNLDTEHIKQGIYQLATNKDIDSRSPADTNLKAYEILSEILGLKGNKAGTTVNIVQPILGGSSIKAEVVDKQ